MICEACGENCKGRFCDNLCKFHRLPFRAWDGEGYNTETNKHIYNVLACYGNTKDTLLTNQQGITTIEAIRFLLIKRKPAINIWFAFDYDVNNILREIPLYPYLQDLSFTNETRWHGYQIKYIPGKIFSISRGSEKFTSYDCFGFFQKSFIKALSSFGFDPSRIVYGKENRSNFHRWELSDVVDYNQHELELLIQLMNKLRKQLRYHAPSKQWYGPGAVANKWLEKRVKLRTEEHKTYPSEMLEAIMRAYFGGRIDVATLGEIAPCYAYDIASAYPFAMTQIPKVISWKFTNGKENHYFGLYRVRWDIGAASKWGPFPWRSHENSVLFPNKGEGWYYGSELFAAERAFGKSIRRISAWIPTTEHNYPLREHIRVAYKQRRELKAKDDPSELSYKLILNSLYGKFAQKQVQPNAIPRFQNYLWAGFITSFTRSMLLDAIARGGDNIVAIATDSVFIRLPIFPLTKDGELGNWQYEGNQTTLILMPGVYARIDDKDVKTFKQRGYPMPFNYGSVLRKWGCETKHNTPGEETPILKITRFVTFRHAIAKGEKEWCYFHTEEKALHNVALLGFGKRFPDPEFLWEETWKEREMLPVPAPAAEELSHSYRIPTFEEEIAREELIIE